MNIFTGTAVCKRCGVEFAVRAGFNGLKTLRCLDCLAKSLPKPDVVCPACEGDCEGDACPRCGGDHDRIDSRYPCEACLTCGGTGTVSAEIAAKYAEEQAFAVTQGLEVAAVLPAGRKGGLFGNHEVTLYK